MLDAESADDDVPDLADGDAQRPQLAIIAGGTGRQIPIEKRYDRKPAQSALYAFSMGFVPGALKDLMFRCVRLQSRHICDRTRQRKSRSPSPPSRPEGGL